MVRLKRSFDFVCVVFLLIPATPIMFLIAVMVRFDSRGPAIFRQTRTGYRGKTFTIFKFRTLLHDPGRPVDIIRGPDPRITRMGKLLRASHMDELPQLWNVIKGDMSMVGPRPYFVDLDKGLWQGIANHAERVLVRPGITGLAQIYGRTKLHRSGVFRRVMKLDRLYIRRQSLSFDLFILWRTVFAVLGMKGI